MTEYAGAFTWKSGSVVSIRSAAVSSIQNGKPSPAIAYARCVCITSFDRPVVPDVGISTATSSGPTPAAGSDPAPGRVCHRGRIVPVGRHERCTSTSAGNGVVLGSPAPIRPRSPPAAATRSASPASVTSSFGWTWPISPASSAAELRGLTATAMAPIDVAASQHSRYGGVVLAVSMTRSPFAHAGSAQRLGRQADRRDGAAERQRPGVAAYPDAVAIPLGRGRQQPRNRARVRLAGHSCPPVPALEPALV